MFRKHLRKQCGGIKKVDAKLGVVRLLFGSDQMQKRKRRNYTREFKEESVKLVTEQMTLKGHIQCIGYDLSKQYLLLLKTEADQFNDRKPAGTMGNGISPATI